jgi:hypothetical protein
MSSETYKNKSKVNFLVFLGARPNSMSSETYKNKSKVIFLVFLGARPNSMSSEICMCEGVRFRVQRI